MFNRNTMKRRHSSGSPAPNRGRNTKRARKGKAPASIASVEADGSIEVPPSSQLTIESDRPAKGKGKGKGKAFGNKDVVADESNDVLEISDSTLSPAPPPPPVRDSDDDSDTVFHQGPSTIKTDPLTQDASVPIASGPMTPNTNALTKATDFDKVVMRSVRKYVHDVDRFIEFKDLRMHSTPEEIQYLQFDGLRSELGWSHGDLMTLFNTINARDWTISKRIVHNPMFANPRHAEIRGDFHNVCLKDQKSPAYFGFVGIVSGSTITENNGRLSFGPLQCFGESFARYIARVIGEDHFGYRGGEGDVHIIRPGYLKAPTFSPKKPGRTTGNTRNAEPAGIVYEIKGTTSQGCYDFDGARLMYGEPRTNDVIFAVVNTNEHGPSQQYDGDFNLSVYKIYILRKLF